MAPNLIFLNSLYVWLKTIWRYSLELFLIGTFDHIFNPDTFLEQKRFPSHAVFCRQIRQNSRTLNCERFKVTFLNNCRWQLGESEGERQTERFSNCLDIELTGKSAKGGSQSERDLDSLQVKMINYLQSFFGPGNFLWFLLRGALQGPGPKVMLSELLLFPITVQNLSVCAFFTPRLTHNLLHFSISAW